MSIQTTAQKCLLRNHASILRGRENEICPKGASCVSFTSQSAYEGELSSSKPLISIYLLFRKTAWMPTHSKTWPEAWRTWGQPVLGAGHGRHTASLDVPGACARPHHQWKARKYSDLCLITNHLHWIFLMYVFTFKHYISFNKLLSGCSNAKQ